MSLRAKIAAHRHLIFGDREMWKDTPQQIQIGKMVMREGVIELISESQKTDDAIDYLTRAFGFSRYIDLVNAQYEDDGTIDKQFKSILHAKTNWHVILMAVKAKRGR